MTSMGETVESMIDGLMRDLHRAVNMLMLQQVIRGSDMGILVDHPDLVIDPTDRTEYVTYHGPTVSLNREVPLGEVWEKQHDKMFRSEYFTSLYRDMLHALRYYPVVSGG